MFYFCSQTIVAIDQVGGNDGFGEVPVDVEKLTTGNAIAVVMGNSNGTVSKALITYSAQDNAVYVTFMNGSEVIDKVAVVNGKAAITATVPTFAEAAGTNYAATKYTFVEWVDAEGNAVTSETSISADTTVYAKYDTGVIYGDADNNGSIRAKDKNLIAKYLGNVADSANKTGMLISSLSNEICGDADNNKSIRAKDKNLIAKYLGNVADSANKTGQPVYVINIVK